MSPNDAPRLLAEGPRVRFKDLHVETKPTPKSNPSPASLSCVRAHKGVAHLKNLVKPRWLRVTSHWGWLYKKVACIAVALGASPPTNRWPKQLPERKPLGKHQTGSGGAGRLVSSSSDANRAAAKASTVHDAQQGALEPSGSAQ